MNRQTNAALLSALVFPGAGHLYLKRNARALFFLVPACVLLAFTLNRAWDRANSILEQINAGTLPFDPTAIADQISRQSTAESPLFSIAALLLVVCWIASTIDAYIIGGAPSK